MKSVLRKGQSALGYADCTPRIRFREWLGPRSDALQLTALLNCEGFTPSGTRQSTPRPARYRTPLGTPPLSSASQRSLACPR